MDPDDAAALPAARRPSTAHDRPSRAPGGPRIRTRTKLSADMHSTAPPSPDAPASPLSASPLSRPLSPSLDSSIFSIDASFAHPPLPASAFAPPPPPAAHSDAAVQAPTTPTPSSLPPSLSQPATPPILPSHPEPSPPKSAPTTFITPPPLTPPPSITFEPTLIPWKGLPFEVAQWTFSSSELQEIVSKAIRLSARDSFVRLLSLQALEVDIVHEQTRLDDERATAQAKWRFEVGRRTMLVQALNAIAASSAPPAGTDDPTNPILGFVAQLASSIAACDTLFASVLHASDQQAQIDIIQHQHWASALGVALRKLNNAHERQAHELKRAQARVQTLEDELEEAWREAEKMAIEFDDLEQEVAMSESEDELQALAAGPVVDDVDADVALRTAVPETGTETKLDFDETGTLGDATINTDIAVVLGVTATAVASKATLVTSAGSPKAFDRSDTKSIRSVKSTRSRRSTRDGPSHVSRISSARTRSRTVSNASLRLPKSLRSPQAHTFPSNTPPIPALPSPCIPGQSFLDMDPENTLKTVPPKRQPEPTIALPTPPHSAGLPSTRVPSIWLESEDGDKSTPLNGLDRTHSLHIFSSLTSRSPGKTRRSNLVMSLKGSGPGSRSGSRSRSGSASGSGFDRPEPPVPVDTPSRAAMDLGTQTGFAGMRSPTVVANGSPTSLPMHVHVHTLAHGGVRGPSLSLSSSAGSVSFETGQGRSQGQCQNQRQSPTRPGSAGARLTTTTTTTTTTSTMTTPTMGDRNRNLSIPMGMPMPKRSLMSRASSVILRRLSQAATGGSKSGGSHKGAKAGKGTSLSPSSSPSRSREVLRLSGSTSGRGRWKGRGSDVEEEEAEVESRWTKGRGIEGENEGEVMLIGSPHSASLDAL